MASYWCHDIFFATWQTVSRSVRWDNNKIYIKSRTLGSVPYLGSFTSQALKWRAQLRWSAVLLREANRPSSLLSWAQDSKVNTIQNKIPIWWGVEKTRMAITPVHLLFLGFHSYSAEPSQPLNRSPVMCSSPLEAVKCIDSGGFYNMYKVIRLTPCG